jgi:pilus assembly protein CpaF
MTMPPGQGASRFNDSDLEKIKIYLVNNVTQNMEASPLPINRRREAIAELLEEIYTGTKLRLAPSLKQQLFRDVLDDILGYGPIQSLLEDPGITEIMVNRHDQVYIEREGKLLKTNVKFESDDHIMRIIEKIILPLGRRIDADNPTVDARLPDGSRVNAVIPPVAIDGPSLTIRKFSKEKLTIHQLIEFGSITKTMADFLEACVVSRLSIVISGGTGSGKTTLLNILSGFIPETERIVTIEDSAELRLHQEHVVRLETQPPNIDGEFEVSIRSLVRNSLRMRPDRIVVGECRGGEAIDMLQAMNTGHDGSLTTVHANSPRDALSRLETLSLMSGLELPLNVIREQIASAVDLIVQQSRMRDGTRKIVNITEVAGMEGNTIVMTDIAKFEQTGVSPDDKILGELKPTGIRPLFMDRLEAAGFKLGAQIFSPGIAAAMDRQSQRSSRHR